MPPIPSLAVSLSPFLPSFLPLFATGDALLTVATGFISDAQAEREGLVPTCVYAILNVVEIKVKDEVLIHACCPNSTSDIMTLRSLIVWTHSGGWSFTAVPDSLHRVNNVHSECLQLIKFFYLFCICQIYKSQNYILCILVYGIHTALLRVSKTSCRIFFGISS